MSTELVEWIEAWTSGFLAHRNDPALDADPEQFMQAMVDSWEKSGGQRAKRIAEALESVPYREPAICNRCEAPKGAHCLGESCNQNCGGKVVLVPRVHASTLLSDQDLERLYA